MSVEAVAVKVTAGHLTRSALLYVRQSTLRQVLTNTESTAGQYALRQLAIALGWPDEQVITIDVDQGQSGASDADREGFQRLVTEVGMGRAGIVLGLEVSRLARNNAEWHRLPEICALTDTLICDEDGLYHQGEFNDRLLLGLKGTMSEALWRRRHRASYDDLPVMPTPTRDRLSSRQDHHDEVGIIRARRGMLGRRRWAGSGPVERLVVRRGPAPVL
jgi:hypothetical protein